MFSDLLLAFIFLASLFFRIFYVSHFDFAFTIDQARDMLEIRKVAVGHDLVFIGPITSLNGVFLGPFWYYFNLLPFLVGGGNPSSLVIFQILFFHASAFIFYLFFRKKNYPLAFWGSLMLLISPRLITATSYAFNANTTPVFVLLTILLLHLSLQIKKALPIFFLGLMSGLTLQMEAAFGVLLLPLSVFWLMVTKTKYFRHFFLGFLLTLTPQVMFEIKNKFIMTKTFLAEFSGQSDILGQRLDLLTKLADRISHYQGSLVASLPLPMIATIILFLVCLGLGLYYRNRFVLINVTLLLISILVYLVYPNRLKDWWTINLTIPYLLIIASSVSILWQKKNHLLKVGILLLFIYFVVNAVTYYYRLGTARLTERSNDPALLLNQTEALDWVYGRADGKGFKVYNFVPAIYDLNYQYLFWWYGKWKYGYHPMTVTYLDGVPEYIEKNQSYFNLPKPAEDLVFLIRENNPQFIDRELAWRQNFTSLCRIGETWLTGNIHIELLTSCKK